MAMARWIFPDVEGQFQKNLFSVQGSLNVLSFDSVTAGRCNLGCIRKWVHTYISINHISKYARALHAHLLV